MTRTKGNKYKLGIALGGGGARGFAHLGVMQGLYEKGIQPDIISGVSAGAIAGAFIAAGHSPADAFDVIKEYNFSGISTLTIPKTGLLSLSKIKSILEKNISIKLIEDLEIPLIVGVSNMLEGRPEYLTSGPLPEIIQASASIPMLFSPVEMKGSLYSDGGVFDNLPIKPLQDKCEKIIAVSISPVQKIKELSNLAQVAARMFQLSVNPNTEELKNQCDYFIEPIELCDYDILDTKHAKEIFNIGYDYVKKMEISI